MKKTANLFGRTYTLSYHPENEAMSVLRNLPYVFPEVGEQSCAVFYDESRGWVNMISTSNTYGWVDEDGRSFLFDANADDFKIQPDSFHHFECMGRPKVVCELDAGKPIFWSSVLQDISSLCEDKGLKIDRPIAFRGHLTDAELEGSVVDLKGKRLFMDELRVERVEVFGFFFQEPEHINRENKTLRKLSKFLSGFPVGGTISGIAFALFDTENKKGLVRFMEPESMFTGLKLDLFEMFGD